MASAPLRLITFNTQKDHYGEYPHHTWQVRPPDLLQAELTMLLRDLQPQLLNLQEVGPRVRRVLDGLLERFPQYRVIQLPSRRMPGLLAMTAIVYDQRRFVERESVLVEFEVANENSIRNVHSFLRTVFHDAERGEEIVVGNTHQHALWRPRARLLQTDLALRELRRHGLPLVWSGDFNTGGPFEIRGLRRAVAPYLEILNAPTTPTCLWERLEPISIQSRIARFIGKVMGSGFMLDHILSDTAFMQAYGPVRTEVLSDFTASDHVPVIAHFGAAALPSV